MHGSHKTVYMHAWLKQQLCVEVIPSICRASSTNIVWLVAPAQGNNRHMHQAGCQAADTCLFQFECASIWQSQPTNKYPPP